MADSKLSQLPAGAPIAAADLFYSDQGGDPVSQTAAALAKFSSPALVAAFLAGVNLNLLGDTEVIIPLPEGVTSYQWNAMGALKGSIATITTAVVGLYTGPGGTGTALLTPTTMSLTSNSSLTAAAVQGFSASGAVGFITANPLYLRVTTIQGAPCTADFFFSVRPGAS